MHSSGSVVLPDYLFALVVSLLHATERVAMNLFQMMVAVVGMPVVQVFFDDKVFAIEFLYGIFRNIIRHPVSGNKQRVAIDTPFEVTVGV